MKKVSIIILSLLVIILITGCGAAKKTEAKEQKLVCTTTEDEDGINIEEVISMTYKNDKLKFMTMEVNTKVTDSDVIENWDVFKESMAEENKEFDKDGVSLRVETNDQTYEYKVILDIDVDNASQEALEEQGFGDLKDDDSTLESSKEAAEQDGAVCVIK